MPWVRYLKHRRASEADYLASAARRRSAEPRGHAQYNPVHFSTDEEIEAVERHCLLEGAVITQTAHRVTKYIRMDEQVGVCSGEFTNYVFVECTNGDFHGRPISEGALKKLGVKI